MKEKLEQQKKVVIFKTLFSILSIHCSHILERMEDKKHIFNFESVGPEREWLKDILLSDTDTDSIISDEDEYIRVVLKSHVKEKKHRNKFYGNVNVRCSKFIFNYMHIHYPFIFRISNMDIMVPG